VQHIDGKLLVSAVLVYIYIRPTANEHEINQTYVEVQIFILGEVKLLNSRKRIKLRIRINGKISWDQRNTSRTADFPTSWPWPQSSLFLNFLSRNHSQATCDLGDISQWTNAIHDKTIRESQRWTGVHFHSTVTHKVAPHIQRQTCQPIFTDDVTRLKLDKRKRKLLINRHTYNCCLQFFFKWSSLRAHCKQERIPSNALLLETFANC